MSYVIPTTKKFYMHLETMYGHEKMNALYDKIQSTNGHFENRRHFQEWLVDTCAMHCADIMEEYGIEVD